MKLHNHKIMTLIAVALVAMVVAMSAAHADDDGDDGEYGWKQPGKSAMPAQTNAKFQQECTGCHIAYPPRFLPAESWRKMMSGLDKHFGSDASLDARDNKEITDFLVANASERGDADGAPLKISETRWFKREHDAEEISPSVWKNPKVKSPSNCGACHTQAEQGDFSERNIRMPKAASGSMFSGLI